MVSRLEARSPNKVKRLEYGQLTYFIHSYLRNDWVYHDTLQV